MKISHKWLQTFFDKALPDADELAVEINAHAFEVEGVEKTADGNDTVLDIKVLPDRAHYALCHRGIAREIRAITGQPLKKEKDFAADTAHADAGQAAEVAEDPSVPKVSVTIEEKDLCSRYMARRIENVKIGESPADIKSGLESIGARAINTVVDATNYIMFDVGQPLHAFDADKVKGGIIVRKAKKGEKITLLDGREMELAVSDLVIADTDGPLAIAGVKGGKKAEVTSETRNIILESANFNPVSVRRTSTRLNIRNDSSKRFENEIIPELASDAMDRVTALILSMSNIDANSASAKAGSITDEWVRSTESWSVTVLPSYIGARIGNEVKEDELKSVLARIGCAVTDKGDALEVIPPHDRLDLKIQDDFVDEIARIKGYGKLESVLPPADLGKVPMASEFYFSEKIKNALVDEGFSEALLYSLSPSGAFDIEYPLASDKSALRESIVSALDSALVMNARNADLLGLDTIKMFEIGKVFPAEGERTVLAIGAFIVKKKKGVTADGIIAHAVGSVAKVLGVPIEIAGKGLGSILKGNNGMSATIEIDLDKLTGSAGTLPADADSVASSSNISDLNFTPLPKDQKYIPFSQYPFITRDIAVFVPESTEAEEVWDVILGGISEAGATNMLARHSLFDTFKKDGKVSYAFRMVFQSMEKTLTDDEANAIMEKIYAKMKENDWQVR